MISKLLLSLSALLALLPVAITSYRTVDSRPGMAFWATMLVAVIGPSVLVVFEGLNGVESDSFSTALELAITITSSFSLALWTTITASIWLFALTALVSREAWRITPLLISYLVLLGVFAIVWGGLTGPSDVFGRVDSWLLLHIASSVATYGLCTIAAIAGVAVYLKERELKRKQTSRLGRLLPSVVDAEQLQLRLLAVAEGVLLLGIITGMARGYLTDGHLLSLDHKSLLSLLAFVVIGVLLTVQWRSGLYARQAARGALIAYLLLTLAYLGVKFILEFIIY